jgi:hypothetical protein
MASQLPRPQLSPEMLLRLQTTAGNRSVQKLLERCRMAALQAAAPPLPETQSMAWWSGIILAAVRGWWSKVTNK